MHSASRVPARAARKPRTLDPRLSLLLDSTRNLEKAAWQLEQAWRQLHRRQEETAAAWADLGAAFNGFSLTIDQDEALGGLLEQAGQEADAMAGSGVQEALRRHEELADHAHELWQFCGAILVHPFC